MLFKGFYNNEKTISSDHNKLITRIKLNKDHDIYNGHFPNNPIIPGVIIIQIIKEILDGLDSTKTAERKALHKSIEQTATTNIEVGSNKQFLDHKALYEYEADLTKSLVNAEKSLTNNEELIYVITDFQNVGNSVEDKKKYAYLILPLAITILILLFAQLLKYLKKEETQDSWRFKKL